MHRVRKIVGWVILLGIAAFFISCSRLSPNQDLPPATAQPPDVSQKVPTNTPKKPATISQDSGGVITFATYSFLIEAYTPILEEFHKQNPEITVQIRDLPATLDTRQIASAADTTLLMFRAPNSGSYFLDLTPFEEGDLTFEPDNFWPGILEACEDTEGRTYGLPVLVEPAGIYYQEKAFDAAGLPYPKPGWTWEEFQKAVNALARTEEGLPVYGFVDDNFIDTPDETLLSPIISHLFDQTGGEIDVDLFKGELQWYLDLVRSGSLYSANIYPEQSTLLSPENAEAWSKAWNETWNTYQGMFMNHPPAMWKGRLDQTYWGKVKMKALPDGSLNMSATSRRIIESEDGIGWVPYPISADGQNDHTTPSTVSCAVISSGTERPRAAWTWLNFLAAHPAVPEWSLAVPAQPSAAEASAYWGRIPEKLREAVRFGMEHGWYSNPYPEAVLAVNQALLKTVAENTGLQVALEEASNSIEPVVLPTPDMTPIIVAPPLPTSAPSATTINYFSLFLGDDRIKNLTEEFRQLHPDITVEVASPSPMGGVAELADAYDCFAWLPEKGLPVDLLQDLDQFLSTEETDVRNDFRPEELNDFSQGGKLFGLPVAYRPYLIYYNADLLAQRGLKPPALDWSYADFIDLINSATSSSEAEPVYGLALEYPTRDIELLLAGRNVSLIDSTGDVPVFLFDTPETRDFVQWLAEQVKSGVILPVTPVTIGTHQENIMTARQLILDGHVAFWMSWFDPSTGGSYALQEAKFPIGFAPIPVPNGTVTWQPNHIALAQYISQRAENPRACWDWIKFLSEQPDSTYGVPARRSIRESEGWKAQVGQEAAQVYQVALEQRRTLSQEDVYSLGPARDWWNELLAEVVSGAEPLPLLAEAQGKADVYTGCLAASSDYQAGSAQQKASAEAACASQADP